MKQPFFWTALGFTAGILVYRYWPESALAWSLKGLLFCLPLLWAARGKKYFPAILVTAFVFLGIFYSHSDHYRPVNAIEKFIQPWSPENKTGFWAKLEGRVKTQPEIKQKGKKTTASFVLSSQGLSYRKNQKYKTIPTRGDVQVFLHYPPSDVPEFGDRITLFGKIQTPKAPLNFGQFDYRRYLASQHIYAVFEGYGRRSVIKMEKPESFSFLRVVFRLRQQMAGQIDRFFKKDSAPLFKALILGMRKSVEPALNEAFLKTGTSHILAVSGLNIAMVAGSIYLCLIALGVEQKYAAVLALLVSLFQVLITGFGIPIQRAGCMAVFGFASLILERERNSLNIFFLVFLLLLLRDTANLDSISFQLSFLSVLSLILFLKLLHRNAEEYRSIENLANGIAVLLGTFPIVLYHFSIFSPVSILANLGAIPLFHLALLASGLSLLVGGIPLAGLVVIKFAESALGLGLAWIHFCARVPWGYFFISKPSPYQMAGYYGLLVLFFVFRSSDSKRFFSLPRSVAAGLWLVVALSFFKPAPSQGFQYTLLSAGKNELAHLEFPGKVHWLINTGRSFPSNQAEWILNPYLRAKGINHLAGILVTDTYKKHWGALKTVLSQFKTAHLLYPAGLRYELSREILKRKVKAQPLDSVARVQIQGGGELFFLSGGKRQAVAVKIVYQNWNFLWISKVDEEMLARLKSNPSFLKSIHVLMLPSGRFEKGIYERLFALVNPDLAAAPSDDSQIKDFLRDRDIPLYDSESYGAITFNIGGSANEETAQKLFVDSFLRGPIGEISKY